MMSGETGKETAADKGIIGDASTELSANRTAMSFERTAMSAHRTLHAVMKTSLSLIGFGFTIFKFFTVVTTEYIVETFPAEAPRRFGLVFMMLGIVIIIFGMFEHYQTMSALRKRKARLHELGLVHSDMPLRIASSMTIAMLLLLIGISAFANLVFNMNTME